MLEHVAIQPPTRGVRMLAGLLLAALALAPLSDAPVSRVRCAPQTTISETEQHPRATLRRRTPGLNPEYLQRELR